MPDEKTTQKFKQSSNLCNKKLCYKNYVIKNGKSVFREYKLYTNNREKKTKITAIQRKNGESDWNMKYWSLQRTEKNEI